MTVFDTMDFARKIRNARNKKNMSQADLADAMGISFQAVSNWERANSMPDITKIPDLCEVLGLTLDELFGGSAEAVETLAGADEGCVSYEELISAAPFLPPQKIRTMVEEKISSGHELDAETLSYMAPFLDEETLDGIAYKVVPGEVADRVRIAPFLRQETLDRMTETCWAASWESLIPLAPFLRRDTLSRLVERCEDTSMEHLCSLAPFLNSDTLDRIVEKQLRSGAVFLCDITGLLPYLGRWNPPREG